MEWIIKEDSFPANLNNRNGSFLGFVENSRAKIMLIAFASFDMFRDTSTLRERVLTRCHKLFFFFQDKRARFRNMIHAWLMFSTDSKK